jgi:hypothetical protein
MSRSRNSRRGTKLWQRRVPNHRHKYDCRCWPCLDAPYPLDGERLKKLLAVVQHEARHEV